nr:topoisomerase DNA-binding C4 zinc finger domain-containing protein [Clostridium hominis]
MDICPRCGGSLLQRNGRNGFFIGCSNFPKCRFTKNIWMNMYVIKSKLR